MLKLRLQDTISGVLLSPGGSTANLHRKTNAWKKRRQNENIRVLSLKACSDQKCVCTCVFAWNKDLAGFFLPEI